MKSARVAELHREDANVSEQLKLQKAAAVKTNETAPVKASTEYRNLPPVQISSIDSIMEAQITLVPVAVRVRRHLKCALRTPGVYQDKTYHNLINLIKNAKKLRASIPTVPKKLP